MLSKVEALHTAARRYCSERADMWLANVLEASPQQRDALYFDENSARFRVLEVIEAAVEAVTPAESASLEEAREQLLSAVASAVDEHARPSMHRVERRVMKEEVRWFAEYLRGLSDAELARVEPPLFRRRLSEGESARVWAELKTRWGVERGRMWYPWGDERPSDAQVFDEDRLATRDWHELRELLASFGVSHLWELRGVATSGRDHYEIELALMEPVDVSLDEIFWSDASFEWLIYRSHEDTVTIVGAELLSGPRAAWPEWRRLVPYWA